MRDYGKMATASATCAISTRNGRAYRHWPTSLAPVGRLIIFHGTHEHGGRYAEVAAAFVRHAVEVYALDFHGHGSTTEGARGDLGSVDGTIDDAVGFARWVARRHPPLPTAILGHSLGAMVSFVAAHRLSTDGHGGAPACVVLSGFAMDSESPPLGVAALTPLLRVANGRPLAAVVALMARVLPQGPATPLAESLLTDDAEQLSRMRADPLHHHGWICNRTAHALLCLRAQCRALLPEWARTFSFLLVHGGDDRVCPRSAADSLLAASPSADKQLTVYDGMLHEVLFAAPAARARVTDDIVQFVLPRLAAAVAAAAKRSRL